MRLLADITPIALFISSSMADDDPIAVELRSILRHLGKRYELFRFSFIEDRASPGGPNFEMDTRINQCDAVAMFVHDNQGREVREGILKEFALARQYNKPIFLFVHTNFTPQDNRSATIFRMREAAGIFNSSFSSNRELIDDLEFTLFDSMLVAFRRMLVEKGRDTEDLLSVDVSQLKMPGVRS